MEAQRIYAMTMQRMASMIADAMFNPPAWEGMSRDDWWRYWAQMNDACPECRGRYANSGPSPHWPHAEHVAYTNRRPWRGPH